MPRTHISPKEKLELCITSCVLMHEIQINTTAVTLDNSVSYLSSSEQDETPKIMKISSLESKQPNREDSKNVQADVQVQILAHATQKVNIMH